MFRQYLGTAIAFFPFWAILIEFGLVFIYPTSSDKKTSRKQIYVIPTLVFIWMSIAIGYDARSSMTDMPNGPGPFGNLGAIFWPCIFLISLAISFFPLLMKGKEETICYIQKEIKNGRRGAYLLLAKLNSL